MQIRNMMTVKKASVVLGMEKDELRSMVAGGQLMGEMRRVGLKDKWFIYHNEVQTLLERRGLSDVEGQRERVDVADMNDFFQEEELESQLQAELETQLAAELETDAVLKPECEVGNEFTTEDDSPSVSPSVSPAVSPVVSQDVAEANGGVAGSMVAGEQISFDPMAWLEPDASSVAEYQFGPFIKSESRMAEELQSEVRQELADAVSMLMPMENALSATPEKSVLAPHEISACETEESLYSSAFARPLYGSAHSNEEQISVPTVSVVEPPLNRTTVDAIVAANPSLDAVLHSLTAEFARQLAEERMTIYRLERELEESHLLVEENAAIERRLLEGAGSVESKESEIRALKIQVSSLEDQLTKAKRPWWKKLLGA